MVLGGYLTFSSSAQATEVSLPQSATEDTQLLLAKTEFLRAAKEAAYNAYLETSSKETGQVLKEDEFLKKSLLAEQRRKKESLIAEELEESTESVTDVTDSEEVSIIENNVEFVTVAPVFEETTPPLLEAWYVDESYEGSAISLDSENRRKLERLVQGEAGNQGFIGAALVAQTIHDTMILENDYDVMSIKKGHKYSGSLDNAPNQDVLDAVSFIFDEGGMAVQHRLIYFYAPKCVTSSFHEKQLFIVEYRGHRFFDER